MNRRREERESDAEVIEATAAAWLAQRDDGGLSPAEHAKFEQWRKANARHEAAVIRLEAAWVALQPLREFRPEARIHPDPDLLVRRKIRRRTSLKPVLAAALAAGCMLIAAWWWRGASEPDVVGQSYVTTNNGYQRATLADGSVIELNAKTVVRVAYTAAERRVRLVRGEAHFTVTKDTARPFRVEAATIAVEAVGTAFNVRLGSESVEVLVTNGRVQVDRLEPRKAAGGSRMRREPADRAQPTIVGVNERTRISTGEERRPLVEKVPPEAIRNALVWQSPSLLFRETPLSEVVAQFNRRNRVQIEIGDSALAALPIGGSFREDNIDAFVWLLAQDDEITVKRIGADRIILERK